MKSVSKILVMILGLACGFMPQAIAQEYNDGGYNPNSVRPIHRDDILIQKRVWRRMELNEKQNVPFMAVNREITRHIIEAAKAGIIPIYANDSLTTRMTKEEFLEKLINPDLAASVGGDFGGGSDWGGGGWGDEPAGNDKDEEIDVNFSPRDVLTIEIMEDMIFDRKRSRLYWDILSFKLIIPSSKFPLTGLEREVAVFKYQDLYNLFKNMPDEAIWFNPQNSAQHKNLTDAFDLRLFAARIVKIANPDNNYIMDEDFVGANPKKAIIYSLHKEYELMTMEHELWEF
jgi:gliding motility associated protien GldN